MDVFQMEIGKRRIGDGQAAYLIAEISGNHGQTFEQAVKLVEAAKESGADAVKFQTYTADTLTIKSDQKYFKIGGGTLWDGRTLHDLYGEAYTPWDWQPKLFDVACKLGMDCFSTAFDVSAVEFLEKLNVPIHKIASFENIDLPLIEAMARTRKPMIISTGMASLSEIEDAVRTARASGAPQVGLMKCTSSYPAAPEDMNLRTIPHLRDAFRVPVGLSDHTLGTAVPVAAVALGACMVEKHFTLDRSLPGPDAAFSLEPREFKSMVEAVRVAEKALGQVSYGTLPHEEKSRIFRRSLFVVQDVKAGQPFTRENVRSIRPGYGLAPKHYGEILGKKAARDIARGTPLSWDLI